LTNGTKGLVKLDVRLQPGESIEAPSGAITDIDRSGLVDERPEPAKRPIRKAKG
jgi:hypothetical protein